MKNLNKMSELGRSMVEMLGVLAIIGVLSVAGIKGYSSAMTRHQANNILTIARVILQEQAVASLTGATLSKASIGMGKLPDGCWICSPKGDDTQLLIGKCKDEKIMTALGSILGNQWGYNTSLKVGRMNVKASASSPALLPNNSDMSCVLSKKGELVYKND